MASKGESQLQLTDINDQRSSYTGSAPEIQWSNSKSVSISKKALVAVVLAVIIIFAIAIIAVYYGHPDYGKNENLIATTTPAPPVTTTDPSLPTDVRLPRDLIPVHYDVRLRPDIYQADPKDFSFTGSVTIELDTKKATDVIVLHYRLLEIEEDSIRVKTDGRDIAVKEITIDKAREFYRIHLADDLTEGSKCHVTVGSFTGPLRPDLAGIYYSSYTDDMGATRYLMTSQAQPTDARKVFPCLDEPDLKATFTTTIERKEEYSSMSNTVVVSNETLGNGWIADHYEPTPPMSTYILAFIVSDFECKKSDYVDASSTILLCARPNAQDQVDYALEIAGPMQSFFEQHFNISYPLPQTIHVAVPDFAAGAMENWGLIIYRETALLYDVTTASAANKQRVAVVVTHELAHMWFGNLVTPTWWDDIWLNEGFASFMEYEGLGDLYPEWRMDDMFITESLHPVFRLDGLVSSHPIFQEVNHPAEISQIFDSITYNKGACVIRMMKYFLGPEVFKDGISSYLKDKAYQAAHHSELFQALTEAANGTVDVADVMDTWIKQMGYPVVTFDYNPTTGLAKVTQEHFLFSTGGEDPDDSPYGYRWEVPLTVASSLNPDWDSEVQWFSRHEDIKEVDIGVNADWFVGNVQQRGYYRVNYDEASWHKLINKLSSNHEAINVKNRAQIIDDLFNLGRGGYVDQLLALNATLYMKDERAFLPWDTVENVFGYIDDMLVLTDGISLFKTYVRQQIEPLYNIIGMDDDPLNDPHIDQLLRRVVARLACGYGVTDCVQFSTNKFAEWMATPDNNAISQNLRSTVYCIAVKNGGMEEWEFAREQYNRTNSAAERNALGDAMGCSKNPGALNRLLQMAIEEKEIRRGDFRGILRAVATNPMGRHLAWTFFKANYDTIFERFGESSFTMAAMVTETTASLSEEHELTDLLTFAENTPNKGSAEFAFKQAIERTQNNIEWRQNYEDNINQWLSSVIS